MLQNRLRLRTVTTIYIRYTPRHSTHWWLSRLLSYIALFPRSNFIAVIPLQLRNAVAAWLRVLPDRNVAQPLERLFTPYRERIRSRITTLISVLREDVDSWALTFWVIHALLYSGRKRMHRDEGRTQAKRRKTARARTRCPICIWVLINNIMMLRHNSSRS